MIYAIVAIIGGAILFLIMRKKPTQTFTPVEAPAKAPVEVPVETPVETIEFDGMKLPITEYKNSVYTNTRGDQTKTAILFGINECDPNVYQGDTLRLRGCVNDVKALKTYLCNKAGYGKVFTFQDKQASIANFLKVWREVVSTAKDGDTILLQMSRHGMSLGSNLLDKDTEFSGKDIDGNIVEGDQGAVMYDGVIVDDCFWRLFLELPKVKLIYLNDSCNSASQYKLANLILPGNESSYRKARSVGKEYLPSKDNVLDLKQLEREFPKSKKKQLFDLVSISGCQDNETSSDAFLGGQFNGAMTYCLLGLLYRNQNVTPKELKESLPTRLKVFNFSQNPQINIEGSVDLWEKPLL